MLVGEYATAQNLVSTFSSYLLGLAHIPSTNKIAASSSDDVIKIYDAATLQFQSQLLGHSSTIHDLRHSSHHPNQILSCSADKKIMGWDVVSNEPSFNLTDVAPNEIFSCDIGGVGGYALAAGCGEVVSIWDIRKLGLPVMLYDCCHSRDVTQVRFNPKVESQLCSGSEDGLVCAFDITKADEDEAVETILMINHCINTLGFFDAHIYCCTSTEQFSIWNLSESTCVQNYGDIREKYSTQDTTVDYMINCHYNEAENELLLFTGSYTGDITTFQVIPDNLQRKVTMKGGHTETVRALKYFPSHGYLLSGGEDGRICQWKPKSEVTPIVPSELLAHQQTSNSSHSTTSHTTGTTRRVQNRNRNAPYYRTRGE